WPTRRPPMTLRGIRRQPLGRKWADWAGWARGRRGTPARTTPSSKPRNGGTGDDRARGPAGGPALARDRAADGRRRAALAAGVPGLPRPGAADPGAQGGADRPAHECGPAGPGVPGLLLAAGLGRPLPEVPRPAVRGLRAADRQLLRHALPPL